jgi:hypothetical protein
VAAGPGYSTLLAMTIRWLGSKLRVLSFRARTREISHPSDTVKRRGASCALEMTRIGDGCSLYNPLIRTTSTPRASMAAT